MTQLSRPFQIALVAFALLVAVWFVALRGHSPSATGGSGSSASGSSASGASGSSKPVTPPGAGHAQSAAAPTRIYHGSAPGVEGLTRAINKAHGAVAQSQNDASSFEHAEPSGSPAATSAAATSAASSAKTTSTVVTVKRSASTAAGHATVVHTTVVRHTSSATQPASAGKPTTAPSMQVAVEHELHQGKTVLILFWNPHGSDDVAVHKELPAVQHALGGKVAVHYASASQVGAYGTITHAIQVYQTPTLLIVNHHGQTTALTGLTDAFSIEQAISESRQS